MDYSEVISEKLREIRLSKKMTQADLAKASGVSRSAISYYELGRAADMDTLDALCKGLRVDLFDFLDECKRTKLKEENKK